MTRRIILFVFAYAVWCVLTWLPDPQELLVGVAAAGLVAYLSGDLFVERPHLLRHPQRYLHFFFEYVPVFLWECTKANLDVAYRVLHPNLPINPGIVRVRTSLQSDAALTLLANSVTLTPGTMSVDVDKENHLLYVHWIDAKTTDTEEVTRQIVGRFEPILKRVFEEDQAQ